ncbi:MAG TPA: hypothetical protein VI259_02825 [Gemmatimonadaceae bacterium]
MHRGIRNSLQLLIVSAVGAQMVAGQARVVSAPPEPSLLNLTGSWSRASTLGDLRALKAPPDFLELRVWRGFGLTETEAVVLRRSNGSWSAFQARVIRCEIQIPIPVGDTASQATLRQYVAEARRHCGTSIGDVRAGARIITADTLAVAGLNVGGAEIEEAWKRAVAAGALQLPTRPKNALPMLDGLTYVIEVRRGDEYRASQIEDLAKSEEEAVRSAKDIYAAVQGLLRR